MVEKQKMTLRNGHGRALRGKRLLLTWPFRACATVGKGLLWFNIYQFLFLFCLSTQLNHTHTHTHTHNPYTHKNKKNNAFVWDFANEMWAGPICTAPRLAAAIISISFSFQEGILSPLSLLNLPLPSSRKDTCDLGPTCIHQNALVSKPLIEWQLQSLFSKKISLAESGG